MCASNFYWFLRGTTRVLQASALLLLAGNSSQFPARYRRESLWRSQLSSWVRPTLESNHTWITQPNRLVEGQRLFVWFTEYWLLHQSKFNYRHTTHHSFKVMFLICCDRSGFYSTISVSKFYQRWVTASTLIMNLAFLRASIFSFTHRGFVEESLSFNWLHSRLSYRLFRHVSELFYLRDSPYGNHTRIGYKLSLDFPVDAAIVTNLKAHQGNLFYLKRVGIFTLGLVPGDYDPWLVTFPIPLLGESLLGEYYFVQSLVRLCGLARQARYDKLSLGWASLNRSISLFSLASSR